MTTTTEEPEVHIDKQGRICDSMLRPLRNKDARSYGKAPFKGKGAGKPHPRSEQLFARQAAFDAAASTTKSQTGRKRPGSYNK